MMSLPERIMEHAEAMPEATPICPAALLHLGKRGAVGQALSRLAHSGRLMRICQGVYMRLIETRFGRCAPGIEKSLQALSELWGETIVPNGCGAANWLGLTTQNPVRSVYLTSGRSRRLHSGKPLRLHRHQADAIGIAKRGESYVLTTGSGSGKSRSGCTGSSTGARPASWPRTTARPWRPHLGCSPEEIKHGRPPNGEARPQPSSVGPRADPGAL